MSDLTKRIELLPLSVAMQLAKLDELKGNWESGANLNPDLLLRLKKSTLITSTGASTRIEGAELSDEQIEKLMKRMKIQKMLDRSEQEVKGYHEILAQVFDNYAEIPLTESAIKHLHSHLMEFVDLAQRHRGNYKKNDNSVVMTNEMGQQVGVVFQTATPLETPMKMENLVAWANQQFEQKTIHPVLIIAGFIIEFLSIHPFIDGNGRMSRILTNLLMLRVGYEYFPYVSHEKLVEDNKADYYIALRRSQKTLGGKRENILPWVEFLLNILVEQAERATELLSEKQLAQTLSTNQTIVLDYVSGVFDASPAEISTVTGINRRTVSQVIGRLLELKLIERFGEGRATKYRKVK